MASLNQTARHSRIKKGILTDKDVKSVVRKVRQMFTPEMLAMFEKSGLDTEKSIRFSLLSSKCQKRRQALGWDLKKAGEKVGVPQYRIRAIESGYHREFSQKEVRLYVKVLGIDVWFQKWQKVNHKAFNTLDAEPDHSSSWAKKVRATNV